MTYENLLIEAEMKGIRVKEVAMYPRLKGLYKNNKILINLKVATDVEKKCILSEEIGHHETSYGNILDDNEIANRKQEVKACRWGYEHTVKIDDIIAAYEYGATSAFEIAEYLEVTENHLINSIENYKKRYGHFLELKNHLIYFTPYLEVVRKEEWFDCLVNSIYI